MTDAATDQDIELDDWLVAEDATMDVLDEGPADEAVAVEAPKENGLPVALLISSGATALALVIVAVVVLL